jgi:hypothetical protein
MAFKREKGSEALLEDVRAAMWDLEMQLDKSTQANNAFADCAGRLMAGTARPEELGALSVNLSQCIKAYQRAVHRYMVASLAAIRHEHRYE